MSVSKAWENTHEIVDLLLKEPKRFMAIPDDWKRSIEGFEKIIRLPDVAACVDGTHILIKRPENYLGLYNRKGVPSVNVQGVVTSNEEHSRFWTESERLKAGFDYQDVFNFFEDCSSKSILDRNEFAPEKDIVNP